jgi:DNA invertase Pin-like site-specific DNA recombinase
LGVSGFRGANANAGKLKAFRRAVEDERVEAGSYLLVEDFDRLSRMNPWDAMPVFQEIINAGITVVTLKDREVWHRDALRANPFLLMKSLFAMWNDHQESVKKSGRVAEAWAAKRKRLASKEGLSKPYTRTCPGWLTWSDKTKAFVALPERVKIVQEIFAKADAGTGIEGIARELNLESAPTWGEGKRKAAFWRASYIRKILVNKAVIGTFTPHVTRTDDDTGARQDQPLEPIPNYYPSVVDPELFERISGRLSTTAARGRNAGRAPTSLVAGVAKCARCGSTMLRVSKGKPPKSRYAYLVCSKAHAKAKGCEYQPVRYESVEEDLRVNARVIIENAPRGSDTSELEAEIAEQNTVIDVLADEQRFLIDEVIKHKSVAMRRALRAKELEFEKANDELTTMRERRDAIASGYVTKRLATLQQALECEPFSIAEANSAMKQAVQTIALNPEGSLTIHWHHSEIPTEDIPFWSKHSRMFE